MRDIVTYLASGFSILAGFKLINDGGNWSIAFGVIAILIGLLNVVYNFELLAENTTKIGKESK